MSQIMELSKKAFGEGKKLFERSYLDAKSVEEAGAVAFECGQVAGDLKNLIEFEPALNGQIRYQIAATQNASVQNGPWHHLYNKMVQGFASSGNIKSEEDAVACAALLAKDETWLLEAERELLKAAIPVLRSPTAMVDFIFSLRSERAVQAMMLLGGFSRESKPVK